MPRLIPRVLLLSSLVLLAPWTHACVGGQSSDDFTHDDPRKQNDPACLLHREPLPDPDAMVLEALARLQGSYAIAGRWGKPSAVVDFAPMDAPFSGRLEIELTDGPLQKRTNCSNPGVEAPIGVRLITDDGALDERVDGIAILPEGSLRETVDGSLAPALVQIEAHIDFGALSGQLDIERNSDWALKTATLHADVTSFGTRGTLVAYPEPLREAKAGTSWTSPAADPMLVWPADLDTECVDEGLGAEAFYPAQTEDSEAVLAAIDRVGTLELEASYEDGGRTTARVSIEPFTEVCGDPYSLKLPTIARIQTADDRIDLTLPVYLDPSYARLHFNERTDVPWAFPPMQLAEHGVRVTDDVSSFEHAGIEAWFDELPEPAGWVTLLGFAPGDCLLCDAQSGCFECASDRRVTVTKLSIGAEAAPAETVP